MEDEIAGRNFNTKELVSSLLNEMLITENEKRKMEVLKPDDMKAAIFDLMSTKNLMVAYNMFKHIRSINYDHEEQKNSNPSPLQNPLENYKIINHLFGLLGFEDQKMCRAVCKMWNFEAELLLRKNGAITFGHLKDSTTMIRRPEDFLETFRNFSVSTTDVAFTSFRFLHTVEWRVADFKEFFKQQKQMKDLQLHSVFIVNEEGNLEQEFDISDWFTDLTVSKLTVRCDEYFYKPPTVLELSTDVLTNLTHINLNYCNLKIGNERLISPIEIEFTNVQFWKDSVLLQEYGVNDLIDFSKAKNITITCGDDENDSTTPNLDLSKCRGLNAKQMSLYKIPVFNWNDCKVVVKTLELGRIPLLVKTSMEIRELYFNGSSIDLFALPLSIEKIQFGWSFHYKTKILSSQPIDLPNLKRLVVERHENFEDLKLFADCPNLLDVEIRSKRRVQFSLGWVPKSVKHMKLERVKDIYGNLNLEKLVLINYSLANAAKVMKRITPKVLVLQWKRKFENNVSVLPFLQEFKNLTLYVGPFIWDDTFNAFETSPIMAYVDQKAEYYVFENNQGRSLPSLHIELMSRR